MKLYPFQAEDVVHLATQPNVLIANDPGTGKTYEAVALDTIRRHQSTGKTLVVAPLTVLPVWEQHLADLTALKVRRVDPKRRQDFLAVDADCYLVHYDVLRLMPELRTVEWLHVIADECLVSGTLIDTPAGLQAIESLKVGDEVYGYDHARGKVVSTQVRHVFRNHYNGDLIAVNNVIMTPNHPVWAESYRPAKSLLDSMYATGVRLDYAEGNETLRVVPVRLSSRSLFEGQAPILFGSLQEQMAMESSRIPVNIFGGTARTLAASDVSASSAAGGTGETSCPPSLGQQSSKEPYGTREGQIGPKRKGLRTPRRRQWHWPDDTSAVTFGSARMAYGGSYSYWARFGFWLSNLIQSRHSQFNIDGGYRSGWPIPSVARSQEARSKEGSFLGIAGMDRHTIYKQGCIGESGSLHTSSYVYNIETGTGNYFAQGLLVHNCHRVQNRKAQQTKALKALTAEFKTGLSGTPVTNTPDRLWSVLHWLYPKAFSSYWKHFAAYVDAELDRNGYYIIKGPKNEAELLQRIAPFCVRRLKAEVLPDLPPKTYTTIPVTLYPQQRRAYDSMRQDLWSRIEPEQVIAAPTALAALTRLQQFADAYATVDDTNRLHLAEPSAKLDVLMDLVTDSTDQLVVFTQYAQMVELICRRLDAEGIDYVRLTGASPQAERGELVERFQQGKVRMFVGTIAAGGIGITLTAASRAIFVDRTWSPADNSQAEDRLHRISAPGAVQIIDLLAVDTVEQGRMQRLETKQNWLKRLLGDT